MFKIKIADLIVAISNKYPFVEDACKKYMVESDTFDFSVEATQEEIDAERDISEEIFSDGYLESVCIYRNIAKELPKYDAFVFHCAAIEYNNMAFCFAARSGTGKTTHIKLWRKVFGDKVSPINGDKPIFRYIDDVLYVYGTPWSGKENFNTNAGYPLKALCFIERATINSIEPLSVYPALNKALKQIYLPKDKDLFNNTLTLTERMLSTTPIWLLKCNISEEAAIIAFNAMNN